MRRLIVNPVASVVLLGLLLADAALLPSHYLAGGLSTAGQVVGVLMGRPRRTIQPVFYDALVVKEEHGMRVLQPNIESWDEATKLIASSPSTIAVVDYTPRVFQRGFWAITREEFKHEIRFVEGGTALTAADRLAARGAVLDALFSEDAQRSGVLVRLRREDFAGSRILWPGVFHNLVTGGVFVLLLWSFRWVPAWIAATRRQHAAAALKRGVCPRCGYSISGLVSGVCPECGAALQEKDPGEVPGS